MLIRKGFIQVAGALCLLLLAAGAEGASVTPAPEPCDPQYWESLKSRAWLEAQREITQNQNLIFKPDSVLEYTCFDLYAAELAEHAKDMFSETRRWGEVLPDTSMDNALEALIGSAFRDWLDKNFEAPDPPGYDLLGGRLNPGAPTNGTGDDYDKDNYLSPIAGGAYACDLMKRVWQEAKCMDAIDVPDEDGFFTFEEYVDYDRDARFLPTRCTKPSQWPEAVKTAYAQVPWQEDKVVTFLNLLDPANCGKPGYAPIETGLTVLDQGTTYQEKICIMPGCFYNSSAKKCQNN